MNLNQKVLTNATDDSSSKSHPLLTAHACLFAGIQPSDASARSRRSYKLNPYRSEAKASRLHLAGRPPGGLRTTLRMSVKKSMCWLQCQRRCSPPGPLEAGRFAHESL